MKKPKKVKPELIVLSDDEEEVITRTTAADRQRRGEQQRAQYNFLMTVGRKKIHFLQDPSGQKRASGSGV